MWAEPGEEVIRRLDIVQTNQDLKVFSIGNFVEAGGKKRMI